MKISVFTPLYGPGNRYIGETYATLVAQTHVEWEWVVLVTGGGKPTDSMRADPRVRIIEAEGMTGGVGALKRMLCGQCTGEVYFELDHDDLLHPKALACVATEIAQGAGFVYSDFAEFKNESFLPNTYSSQYGWEWYQTQLEAMPETPFYRTPLIAMRAPEATPHNLRSILWSPNHLRAWRRGTYWTAGGHDPSLRFADDHDLVVKTFLIGAHMVRVTRCLYYYRVHDQQNVKVANAEIQQCEARVYDRHVYKLAERWADDSQLLKLDLCGGHGCPDGYVPIDRNPPAGGIMANLDDVWPVADSSAGVLRAFDAIEHLRDPVHTMNEAWRVLAPGGMLLVRVPSTKGPGAFCDPTHVSFWNRLSFRYYTDRNYAKYVPEFKGRFQLARLIETGDEIPYVIAELVALKSDFRTMGEILI